MNIENASFIVPIISETSQTNLFRVREETTASVHLVSPVALLMTAKSSENLLTYLVNLSIKWAASQEKSSQVKANIKGIMVKINEASSLPVAIEMQQGCFLSDAWSLLGRFPKKVFIWFWWMMVGGMMMVVVGGKR
ncbi:hypothetical protein Hdeb2414_s0004g00122971 [Helianthus debilis subsp. tardiflorus]